MAAHASFSHSYIHVFQHSILSIGLVLMIDFLLGSWRNFGLRTVFLITLTTFLYASYVLLWPIFVPTIISYPWPRQRDAKRYSREKDSTAVLAGSYNPPHNGHLAMIMYLCERFGRVIVVVGMNPDKSYLVTPHERADLIRKMLQDTPASNVRVEVVSGYIWRSVKPMGASLFVRGIRSWEKDGAAERQLQILNTWGPLVLGPLWWPLPTVFLQGKPEYNHVSSTLVRDMVSRGQTADLEQLVPGWIVPDVITLYKGRKLKPSGAKVD